jgi:hypothetical protein
VCLVRRGCAEGSECCPSSPFCASGLHQPWRQTQQLHFPRRGDKGATHSLRGAAKSPADQPVLGAESGHLDT